MSTTDDYTLVRSEISALIGTPTADWSTRESTDVTACLRRGVKRVIHNAIGHQFSWMQPVHRFSTADGQRRYVLPADFEQFIYHISFDGDNYQHPPITQKPAARLHQMYSEYASTGVPSNFALESLSHDGTTEQVQQVVLHPTPNGEYQLVGPYQVGPIRDLTSTQPWFPGGPENRELFIASCLAQAEIRFMDGVVTTWRDEFQSELVAAVSRDHRRGARNLGPMKGRRAHDYFRHHLSTTYLGAQEL